MFRAENAMPQPEMLEDLDDLHLTSSFDTWQAASLLIGLYGKQAVHYANDRRAEVAERGDLTAARTWDLIVSEVERVLRTAPATRAH